MPRAFDTTNDSRPVMIANGAGLALGVVTLGLWLASAPDLPDLVKLGFGLVVSLVTLAFLALVVHRSTTITGTNVVRFPTPA